MIVKPLIVIFVLATWKISAGAAVARNLIVMLFCPPGAGVPWNASKSTNSLMSRGAAIPVPLSVSSGVVIATGSNATILTAGES